jgi:hypothetical protein
MKIIGPNLKDYSVGLSYEPKTGISNKLLGHSLQLVPGSVF